jgi:hypothetical protein
MNICSSVIWNLNIPRSFNLNASLIFQIVALHFDVYKDYEIMDRFREWQDFIMSKIPSELAVSLPW